MLIYAEEKGVYVLEIGWTVALFPWNIFLGPHGYLSYSEFKAKLPNVKSYFLLYEGILITVKCYQRFGLDVKENFVIGDAFVWRYLYNSSVTDIYSCL